VSIILLSLFYQAIFTFGEDIIASNQLNRGNFTHGHTSKNITYRKNTEELLNDLSNLIKQPQYTNDRNDNDLAASASEHVSARLLSARTYFNEYPGSCYSCNSVPWIPLLGRSLNFPPASRSNDIQPPPRHFQNNVPFLKEKQVPAKNYGPPVDQYGAPRGAFNYPRPGGVVDYMVPPPFRGQSFTGKTYGPPKPLYLPTRTTFSQSKSLYKAPNALYNYNNYNNFAGIQPPPPLYPPGNSFKNVQSFPISSPNRGPPLGYGQPNRYAGNNQIATTYLRPLPGNGQPLLPQNNHQALPLESTGLPPAVPSDSYGEPLQNVAPLVTEHGNHLKYRFPDPVASGSGDSAAYSHRLPLAYFRQKATDVQVVPSVRLADFTASIQHPINLIQSPILDLSVNDQEHTKQEIHDTPVYFNSKDDFLQANNIEEHEHKLDEDTYTSASNVNSTYTSNTNYSTINHINEAYDSSINQGIGDDFGNKIIHKLIIQQNIIPDAQNKIVNIEKNYYNPERGKIEYKTPSPSIYNNWVTTQNTVKSTKLINQNLTYVTPLPPKTIQIIVPYLKAPDKEESWTKFPSNPSAIYNKNYTTLAPVFVPPPMVTENSNLWIELAEDIEAIAAKNNQAQGFTRTTTESNGFKEYKDEYDGTILQKNIDDWTRQSYANGLTIADKLTTKLTQIKNIPQEYLTTTISYQDRSPNDFKNFNDIDDHLASSSNNREIISNEIDDSTSDSTTVPPQLDSTVKYKTTLSYKLVVKDPKPTWDANKVTLSNSTHEKVYVVTPQIYTNVITSTPATAFSMAPKIQNGKVNNDTGITKITVRVEGVDGDKENRTAGQPLKVVYSEWPHLINDLETTTPPKPTSRHPLFGLMDLAPYTESPNNPVDTLDGHSKVANFISIEPNTSSTTQKTV
ncbi:hypothetical protein GWI33_011861, partial [Rhynchophorus ferrugineus]